MSLFIGLITPLGLQRLITTGDLGPLKSKGNDEERDSNSGKVGFQLTRGKVIKIFGSGFLVFLILGGISASVSDKTSTESDTAKLTKESSYLQEKPVVKPKEAINQEGNNKKEVQIVATEPEKEHSVAQKKEVEAPPTIEELIEASKNGEDSKVNSILEKAPQLANGRDKKDLTPLHVVAFNGNYVTADILIDKGAEVNAKSGPKAITPLHFASFSGHLMLADLLLTRGAKVDLKNKDGATPLHLAAANDNYSVVEILVKNGADVNARSKDGMTPLKLSRGNMVIAEFLKKHGAK